MRTKNKSIILDCVLLLKIPRFRKNENKRFMLLTTNWRKKGWFFRFMLLIGEKKEVRMIQISKRENFYQQEYCGCVYSLRDTNNWRKKTQKGRIKRGLKFYGKRN